MLLLLWSQIAGGFFLSDPFPEMAKRFEAMCDFPGWSQLEKEGINFPL